MFAWSRNKAVRWCIRHGGEQLIISSLIEIHFMSDGIAQIRLRGNRSVSGKKAILEHR